MSTLFEKKVMEWAQKRGLPLFGAKIAFAREVKASKNAMNSWVKGKSKAEDPTKLKNIAETLGVSIKEVKSYFEAPENDVTPLNIVNDSDGKPSVTVVSPLPVAYVPMYGKVTGGAFRLTLSHPTEDTLPIIKPAQGTYIGLKVHGNGLEEYRLFAGDGLMVELQDWALDDELVLLKEGEEYTITRYTSKEKRPVVGVVRKRLSDV